MQKFDFTNLTQVIPAIKSSPVYFTIDLDVLDPSIFPGTGTPEAGGVTFDQLLEALLLVVNNCQIIACDINELSPVYDNSGISTATAGKVVRELLLALSDKL